MDEQSSRPPAPRDSRARRQLSRLIRRQRGRAGFWRGHLATYGTVNAFLAFLNLVTPSSHPWFLYVLGAWAIPLGFHWVVKRRRERLQKRLEARLGDIRASQADIPEPVFRPLRKLHRATSTFLAGATVAGTVSGYLFLINALNGGPFWSIIPAASLALPVFLWSMLLRSRRRRLGEELERAEHGRISGDAGSADDHPAVRDAREIRERVRRLVDQGAPGQLELLSHVDELVDEIARLAGLERQFEYARSLVPLSELERERRDLAERAGASRGDPASSSMLREYESSLAQVDTQIASLRELENRHEILELRLRTGVSSLRQISLELVRLRSDQALSELDDRVSEKADELARQLEDLQQSYRELSEDLRAP